MVYYYAYLNSANICEQVYAMPSPITGSNYILLDSYDTSLIGKRYNNGVWEEVTWYYYAKLDDRDIVVEIVSNPDTPLTGDDLISISSADTTLIGKWYNRETEQFVEAPIHVLAMHSTDEINVGEADKWLTTEINEINSAISDLETAVDGKADTDHTHTGYALAEHTHTGYAAAAHSHATSDITGLDSTLTAIDNDISALETSVAGKAASDHTHTNYAEVGHTHSGYAAADHNHNSDYAELAHTHSEYAAANHNHDTAYAAAAHTHTAADITGLPSSVDAYSKTETDGLLDAKLNASAYTAADVLAKIKTVDGQNSGLDADMLDGHDTDYFATAEQLAGKANADHTHTGYAAENHTHSSYAAVDHTHTGYATTASVTALETAVNGKASSNHNHDTAYAAISHTHAMSEVTGLETALSGKASADHTHTGFAAANHTHSEYATAASVTALTTTVNGKADTDHTHDEYATNAALNSLAEVVSGKAAENHTHSQYTTLSEVLSAVYPVGSIYTSVSSNVNPSAVFGGTWVSFGVGRVLMGVETTENAEETGGNETVTLAAHKHTTAGHVLTLNEIPEHNHALLNYNVDGNTSYTFTKSSVEANIKKGFDGNVTTTYKGGSQSHSHGDTGTAGAATISVVQPYITCYMWKRVS